ncbi:MAG: hypothetical protein QOF89_527 [Acidobacteriota bacterium]|jgi:hypothetical protein|nr:hypothetical protein [Acidobacteriota bacterium]
MSEPLRELSAAWRMLAGQWAVTRSHWADAIAAEFEGRYWTELQQQTNDLIRTAEQLDETLARALRSVD